MSPGHRVTGRLPRVFAARLISARSTHPVAREIELGHLVPRRVVDRRRIPPFRTSRRYDRRDHVVPFVFILGACEWVPIVVRVLLHAAAHHHHRGRERGRWSRPFLHWARRPTVICVICVMPIERHARAIEVVMSGRSLSALLRRHERIVLGGGPTGILTDIGRMHGHRGWRLLLFGQTIVIIVRILRSSHRSRYESLRRPPRAGIAVADGGRRATLEVRSGGFLATRQEAEDERDDGEHDRSDHHPQDDTEFLVASEWLGAGAAG